MSQRNDNLPDGLLLPSEALTRFTARPDKLDVYRAEEVETSRYGFMVGTMGLLLAGGEKSEVIDAPGPCPIPNTPLWFRGMINVRGNLIPVINMDMLLDTGADQPGRWVLMIGEGSKSVGISIDDLPVVVDASRPVDALPPLADILQNHTKTAFLHAEDIWLDVDFDGLFQEVFSSFTD